MLECGRVEQADTLIAALHDGQVAGMSGANQLARKIRSVERVGEEKPQRRHDTVHRRYREAGLVLLDLELTDVLRRLRVRRTAQMGRKTTDIADIIALRLALEPAHRHFVDQALAKRTDRASRNKLRHHLAPCVGHNPECGGPSGQLQIKHLSHAVMIDR